MHFGALAPWLFRGAWIAFAVIWTVAAFGADRNARRPSGSHYWPHLVASVVGVGLMTGTIGRSWPLSARLSDPSLQGAAIGFALTVLGLALAVWARLHLGRYWSAAVGSKAEHRLIETGPYARIRHPIYSGIGLAVLGSAFADGILRAWLGALLVIGALILKSRREEAWLTQEFGSAYADYRRRAWALVPLIY